MKNTSMIFGIVLCITACHKQNEKDENFISERVSRTASFTVDQSIDIVFPLYGAFEERKWAPGWEPVLIYPSEEVMDEGTTFKIIADGHGHGDGYGSESESEYLWIVSKYNLEAYLVQYLVSTPNRFWTITVDCEDINNGEKTKTTVTYSFTGLNRIGNKLNKSSVEKMYEKNLSDWKALLNAYFAKEK